MGIQVHVLVKDLEARGVKVHVKSTDYYDRDHEGNEFLDYTIHEASFFVWGKQYFMHADARKESLWIDVNHWGENRERYIPMFTSLGVNYIES
jgi:hypothetical protein